MINGEVRMEVRIMAFWATLIQTLIKMVIVGAGAFAGIKLGKKLRDNKNAKAN